MPKRKAGEEFMHVRISDHNKHPAPAQAYGSVDAVRSWIEQCEEAAGQHLYG